MHFRTRGELVVDRLNVALLFVIAALMIFPFFYMLVVSFTSYREYMNTDLLLWPKTWVLDSYRYIFSSKQFMQSIGNTVWITVIGTVIDLAMTSTMAYGLSRQVPGRKYINFMVLLTFLFSGGMIPTYLVVKATGLIDTSWALILPGAISAFNLLIMRQFFMGIPNELTEAAIIDGASEMKVYTHIILPLSKPVLAAFGLFCAVGHWNTFFDAILYLNNPDKWTIQVILRQIVVLSDTASSLKPTLMAQQVRDQHLPPPETIGMAAILVATVPILFVYPFLQKHFAKGVMLGAVKG
ncbi:carbohydrate ABC transporter permease [Paenibacillus rhizovicinus]|uniref:Carbohydrate ABC transporter permease n=1 Tax=Paenibacillus rhizovicinus TaxID=2704463 RepID=A0A6C0NYX3_9BACL|nr:carbohydrate ABC transporter permease [Paenibacillus rhizovicinus]QHW31450.1 carbohydrate ABC transporter permease [Paenibacillus rhizovicinus]